MFSKILRFGLWIMDRQVLNIDGSFLHPQQWSVWGKFHLSLHSVAEIEVQDLCLCMVLLLKKNTSCL